MWSCRADERAGPTNLPDQAPAQLVPPSEGAALRHPRVVGAAERDPAPRHALKIPLAPPAVRSVHKRAFRGPPPAVSFDHLIGDRQQRVGNFKGGGAGATDMGRHFSGLEGSMAAPVVLAARSRAALFSSHEMF
jgi:hypothetical protein